MPPDESKRAPDGSAATAGTAASEPRPDSRRRDFRLFWVGQTISEFGSSFTLFALPLLVFKLTGSAVDLAIATAAGFLPYLLFGLVLGAWGDRLDRKRLMVAADLARGAVIATIPLLAHFDALHVWWIYGANFVITTFDIAFSAGAFAVVPSLVARDALVDANGRLLATAQAAQVAGPIAAGALMGFGISTATVLYADTASFLLSAIAIAAIATPLSADRDAGPRTTTIRAEIVEGLRYVFGHPLLRNLALLSGLLNFTIATQWSQLVFFAKEHLHATDAEVGLLWAAGSAGVIVFAVGASRLSRLVGISRAVLGSVGLGGVVIIVFAVNPWYALALPLWALRIGLGQFMGVNITSLRQMITPRNMLSRVGTVAQVIAWSTIPAGALVGGWAIDATGDVSLVYAAVGSITLLLAVVFSFTDIRDAERHVETAAASGDT